jgi:hypothetical protein
VEADEIDAGLCRFLPKRRAAANRKRRDRRRERERRELDAVVADRFHEPADVAEGPAFEQLVADGEFRDSEFYPDVRFRPFEIDAAGVC